MKGGKNMTGFEALLKARKISDRYFRLYKKFIYPTQVYYKLCVKYDLFD